MQTSKKVLVLCTGNSCRSIIAEALINAELDCVVAESAGVEPSGKVNPNARKVLERHGIWRDCYHSKPISKLNSKRYDLVVTVCDGAKEACPAYPLGAKRLHIGFQDPDGRVYEAFEATFEAIKTKLIPAIKKELE